MNGHRASRISPILLVVGAVAMTAAFLLPSHEVLSQSAATVIAVAEMEIGKAPTDFSFARTGSGGPSQWTVIADETVNGALVIEQSSADRTDYRFPLAIYQPLVAKNVDVSISFRPVAGRVDQAGGIAVRVTDADNYYVARANALENNVRFYRVVKGSRQQIEGVNIMVTKNEWHTLGLKADGDQFSIGFDGKTLFTTTDRAFANAGKIALWTKSDSVTRFSQISIDVLPDQEKGP
jgi:hypothetical protein